MSRFLGSVLTGLHQEAARIRYYGGLMASYAVDIQNLMVEGKSGTNGEVWGGFSGRSERVMDKGARHNARARPEIEQG